MLIVAFTLALVEWPLVLDWKTAWRRGLRCRLRKLRVTPARGRRAGAHHLRDGLVEPGLLGTSLTGFATVLLAELVMLLARNSSMQMAS